LNLTNFVPGDSFTRSTGSAWSDRWAGSVRTYHRRRRQTRLGRLTPVEYETIMTPAAARQAA
jgi:hypothetical protein